MKTLLTFAFLVLITLSSFSQDIKNRKEPKPSVYYALYHPIEHRVNVKNINYNVDIMISLTRLENISKLLEKEIKYDPNNFIKESEEFEALNNLEEFMKKEEQKLKYVAPCID